MKSTQTMSKEELFNIGACDYDSVYMSEVRTTLVNKERKCVDNSSFTLLNIIHLSIIFSPVLRDIQNAQSTSLLRLL